MSDQAAVRAAICLLNFSLEATAILLLAWIATALVRRSAGLRHAIWVASLVTAILLPGLALFHTAPVTVHIPIQAESAPNTVIDVFRRLPEPLIAEKAAPADVAALPSPVPRRKAPDWALWARWFLGVWLFGVSALVAWAAFAFQGLLRLRRCSSHAEWNPGEFEALSERLSLRRAVQLRVGNRDYPVSAMTWGTWRPVVLLPKSACNWPAERRELVLLHELAHVKRYDGLVQMVVALVSAFLWCNPAVWFAVRALRAESEAAADDAVLHAGVRPSDYAANLVTLAASIRHCRQPRVSFGVFMVKQSGIEKRVRSIVDPNRMRRGATLTQVVTISVIGLVAGFSLGDYRPLLTPVTESRTESPDKALAFVSKPSGRDLEGRSAERPQPAAGGLDSGGVLPEATHQPSIFSLVERQSAKAATDNGKSRYSKNREIALVHSNAIRVAYASRTVSRPDLGLVRGASVRAMQEPEPIAPAIGVDDAQDDDAPVAEREAATPLSHGPSASVAASGRPLEPFHAIVAGPAMQVILRVGRSQTFSAVVPEDMKLDEVARVENGVLHLGNTRGFPTTITTPRLDSLVISSASTVQCTGVDAKSFQLVVSGSSTVSLSGRASDFLIQTSGGSTVAVDDLRATKVRAEISGGSSVKIDGQMKSMNLQVSGGTSVATSGRVDTLTVEAAGGSSVDSSKLTAQAVSASAVDGSKIVVHANKSLIADAKRSSQITFSGHPHVLQSLDNTSKISQ